MITITESHVANVSRNHIYFQCTPPGQGYEGVRPPLRLVRKRLFITGHVFFYIFR